MLYILRDEGVYIGDCTEEDIDVVLHWKTEEGTGSSKLYKKTTVNPTFTGVSSHNLENHLLPTFQKCLCIFYTLRLVRERPILWFQPLASFKKTKQKKRTTETSLHNCCATNDNGSLSPSPHLPPSSQMDVVKDLCNWY